MNSEEKRLIMAVVEVMCSQPEVPESNKKRLLNLTTRALGSVFNAIDSEESETGLIFLNEHSDDSQCKIHKTPQSAIDRIGDKTKKEFEPFACNLSVKPDSKLHKVIDESMHSNKPFNLEGVWVRERYPHVNDDSNVVFEMQIANIVIPTQTKK